MFLFLLRFDLLGQSPSGRESCRLSRLTALWSAFEQGKKEMANELEGKEEEAETKAVEQ